MQRQSLGSPSPRLNGHGRGGSSSEISAASQSPSSPSDSPVTVSGENDDVKLEKLRRRRSSPPPTILRGGPEKYIHLIPILVLLCFLVLYLCSHEPSPTELAGFNGFKHPSEIADSRAIEEFERVLEKGDILAIRSLRNLQEIKKEGNKSSRSHRKLGHF